MKQYHLNESPIVYYIIRKEKTEWVLFLHAAFVHHDMFRKQISYFQDNYSILTLDILGHGKSTKARKGDVAQDFANRYPEAVQSLACFGGYDINNFDTKMQRENQASQTLMMLKAVFSIKWFAKSNKKISAYVTGPKGFLQDEYSVSKEVVSVFWSIEAMKNAQAKLDRGENYYEWDCDFCNLQSSINVAEVEQIISPDQAWYLREKYLGLERV